VRCIDGQGNLVAFTVSDNSAIYQFSDLPVGTYTVIGETWIDNVRYARTYYDVVVNENETTVLIIVMYES
jgi:hypothetical protein